ncbi:outer membrane beta-barrel protein [Pontibacter cellulosilyticus]|uniref:PorT family protein n=1 Tax=Pontibacter cellulosilyticus TaxID=1720253 RepID=A0A923SKR5_9BACT|nr:outer membrane beta-barrel protein [Pontibacter cellulosilyticus]MBC5994046.1 PorT family protein [Pontibacter cellulosilyticus]
MKKIIIIIVAIMGISFGAEAQKVQVGLRLGGNYSNFIGAGADSLDLEGIWGGHGGLIITVPIVSKHVAVRSDIIYSMKGAKSENDSLNIDLGYLDVPIMGQLIAGPFYLEAGPQMSFKVKSDIKDKENRENVQSLADNFKRTSLSYAAGAGFKIPSIGLDFGVRYNGDLSKLVKNVDNKEFRNSVLMFTTSYGF